MENTESCCALDYDELFALLDGMGDEWVLDTTPQETSALDATISPRNKSIRSKKPRRYPRIDILNTRRQMNELQLQLQIMKVDRAFYESLKATKSSFGLDWRQFASRERFRLKTATQVNTQLRKRFDESNLTIRRGVRLINRQKIENMPKSVQLEYRIVGFDSEENIYRALAECLQTRSKGQLNAIVTLCDKASAGSASKLEMHHWSTYALEKRGVCVEFQEYVVLPFSATVVSGAMSCWPSLNEAGIGKMLDCNATRGKYLTNSTESSRRLILRQIETTANRTILLWEDAFSWQSGNDAPNIIVRGSGWVLVAPTPGHEEALSVVHSGAFIYIHSTDGSTLQPTNALVNDISEYTKLMQKARITCLESVLIGEQQRQE